MSRSVCVLESCTSQKRRGAPPPQVQWLRPPTSRPGPLSSHIPYPRTSGTQVKQKTQASCPSSRHLGNDEALDDRKVGPRCGPAEKISSTGDPQTRKYTHERSGQVGVRLEFADTGPPTSQAPAIAHRQLRVESSTASFHRRESAAAFLSLTKTPPRPPLFRATQLDLRVFAHAMELAGDAAARRERIPPWPGPPPLRAASIIDRRLCSSVSELRVRAVAYFVISPCRVLAYSAPPWHRSKHSRLESPQPLPWTFVDTGEATR